MSDLIQQLEHYWQNCCESFFLKEVSADDLSFIFREADQEAAGRKCRMMARRNAAVVKNMVKGRIFSHKLQSDRSMADYILTIDHFIIHKHKPYIETQCQERRAVFEEGVLIDDYPLKPDGYETFFDAEPSIISEDSGVSDSDMPERGSYSRLNAVKYAERWWDDYNPAYRRFDNDCTNYISQCLRAGGAPKRGASDRNRGWWYTGENWSFSWAVAHSLRWYLSGSTQGLQAREVSSPEELLKGDVICYDFTGDGRWQHTTIVTDKDADDMPLVNAHTANSRMRYWAYEDSTAWTPEIQYKFFSISDFFG